MSNTNIDADCLACNSINNFKSIIQLLNRISLSYDKKDMPLLCETYIDISYDLIENIKNIDYNMFQTTIENSKEKSFDLMRESLIDFLNYTILLVKKEKKRF